MQEADIGTTQDYSDIARGNLIFWKGHVAICTSAREMIHANAHHMAVAYEDIQSACQRIEQSGGGPVTSIKRF